MRNAFATLVIVLSAAMLGACASAPQQDVRYASDCIYTELAGHCPV